MREVGRALGIILGILGVVWIAQGLDVDVAPESFMSGDPVWVALGAVAVLIGGSLIWKGRSRK